MAQRTAFLITAASWSMKSAEVDQGSKQLVMMYFTPVLLDGSSWSWKRKQQQQQQQQQQQIKSALSKQSSHALDIRQTGAGLNSCTRQSLEILVFSGCYMN